MQSSDSDQQEFRNYASCEFILYLQPTRYLLFGVPQAHSHDSMDSVQSLPALSVGVIIIIAVLSGPLGVLDLTTAESPCDEDVFPGTGNATVEVTDTPDTATLSKSRFGAEVYRLELPTTTVNVSDVRGRPTLSYRIRIPGLSTELGSTTTLSSCTTGRMQLTRESATFEPDQIRNDSYDATLFVVYRGTADGEKIERYLRTKNVTVEVER